MVIYFYREKNTNCLVYRDKQCQILWRLVQNFSINSGDSKMKGSNAQTSFSRLIRFDQKITNLSDGMFNNYELWKLFAGSSTDGLTTAVIIAMVTALAAGGILIAVVISVAVWRSLHIKSAVAAAAFVSPSSQTVEVACRPQQSIGSPPTVHRDDLLTTSHRPRFWFWTPCGTSAPTTNSWNARHWYKPDEDIRLVLPEPVGSWWDWTPLSDGLSGSRSQDWYRPSYHGGSITSNTGVQQLLRYYSWRVVDPHSRRPVPTTYVV